MSSNDMAGLLIGVGFALLVCATIGALVGGPKGRSGSGFALGLLLGPIGIVIVAVMSPAPVIQQRRDQALAAAMAAPAAAVDDYKRKLRQWAVAEAIRRDPTLAKGDSPETLERLDMDVARIEREAELLQARREVT